MPNYCYRTPDREIHELYFPFGNAPEFVMIDGEKAMRDIRAEICSQSVSVKGGSGHVSRTWPQTCVASGVHPEQAGQLRNYLKDRGVPTEVLPTGDPVYTSAAHKKKALRARGMCDKSAFC